ncbi:MAG: Hpt domain-containing protein [Acetatifactor sp.]|nr:Hpt domain-containing protein [Acetatifactor sp.]
MTIDDLRNLGANVDEGVARCAGNATFYVMLVPKALEISRFETLDRCVKAKQFKEAFEAAHALKGVLGNLSLTPIYEPICEITELLRTEQDVPYEALLETIWAARNRFAEKI